MRALFIALTVLSALITEGDCLACETCQSPGSISCTGTVQPCAEGVTYCVKGFKNNTLGSVSFLTAFKKCVDPVKEPACDRNIIFRNDLISLRITRVCCTTNGCNGGDVDAPIIDETPNGLRCPICFTDQSADGCTGIAYLMCTGNEDFCGSFTGIARRPAKLWFQSHPKWPSLFSETWTTGNHHEGFSIKGCQNKDACEAGILGIEAPEAYDLNLKCT